MKSILCLFLLFAFTASCNKDESPDPVGSNEVTVRSASTFNVTIEQNVTYAKGLAHQTINSSANTTLDLKLDIYQPVNDAAKRPAMLLFHGGGFSGGSRTDPNIVNLANYFASRGWVVFSISYRLLGDRGTVPTAWVNYAQSTLPPNQIGELLKLYPAHRDGKAALRWVMANADLYKIDKNSVTVGGGSAGAILASAIGITEATDFTDEIPVSTDPTISTIQKEQPYKVHTILDFWGSGGSVDLLKDIYGLQRYGSNDAPILIAHGTNDATVPFSNAEALRDKYQTNGVNHVFYALQGYGHGAWDATVNGKRLEDLAFDFIVLQQKLTVK